jgi:hypothetical protein
LVRGCRGHFEALPNIWAYGWDIGLLQCALSPLFFHDMMYTSWFLILFQNRKKRIGNMFDLTNYSNSTSVPISHINAFLPKDKLIIFKIEIILTKDTS